MSEAKGAKGHGGATARTPRAAAMSVADINTFLVAEFPHLVDEIGGLTVLDASADHATVGLAIGNRHLRPGGTVSGPAQFYLADVCAFIAVLAAVGPVALVVTTSATINFLKRPAPTDLVATSRILKRGKRLVVVDCTMHSDGDDEPVAHAVLTYALPQK